MCVGGRLGCVGCPPWRPPIAVNPNLQPPPVVQKKPEEIIIPLTGVITTVRVVDFTAEVTIKQRYENIEEFPIEAVYEFPLEPTAAICAFRAEVDGKVVEGQIKEKEKAKDTYDDAIASGHGAYLLEERSDAPNIFSASVGNLPPKKAVLITIVYVTELGFEEGKLKFTLPTQPYAPNGRDPQPKFNQPSATDFKDVGYGLDVAVHFDMSSPVKSLSSPSHPIEFQMGDTPNQASAHLRLSEPGIPLTKNFELLATLPNASQPSVRVEQDAKTGKKVAMVAFYPQMSEDEDVISEMIFLVDRSGSMAGSRIKAVAETLQIFLRSLPEGTYFNIIGFGDRVDKLFKGPTEKYDERTLKLASDKVASMTANLGGTDIKRPLLDIFAEKPRPGVPRQIFLLTDGEVSNTDECISAVRDNVQTTRVFTFGIGDAASVKLCEGIAEAGEGRAEFIRTGTNMQEKVMRQLNRALKPAMTDVAMDWGVQNVEQTPFHLPPLFSGGRLLVYAWLPKDVAAGKIVLQAHTTKGPQRIEVPFDPTKVVANSQLVQRLAARAAIRDLQEERSYMHDEKHRLIGKYKPDDVKAQIISLSLATGVISKYTAFVAVEKRTDATEGEMKLRKIAIEKAQQPQQQSQPQPAAFRSYSISAASGAAPPAANAASARGGDRGGGGGGPVGRGRGARPGGTSPRNYFDSADYELSKQSAKDKKSAIATKSAKPKSAGFVSGLLGKSSSAKSEGWSAAGPAPRPPPKMMRSQEEKESHSRESSDDDEDDAYVASESLSTSSAVPLGNSGAFFIPPAPQQQQQQAPASPPPAAASTPTSSSAPPPAIMNQIIMTQAANGSFSLASVQLFAKTATESSLRSAFSALPASLNVLLLATAVVCAYMQLKHADQRANWDLVVKKAKRWLKKESDAASVAGSFDWDAAAAAFVKANAN